MVGREKFAELVSRVGEEVGEGDCLYNRHSGGTGSRSTGNVMICGWV
jgi:hypothetical protein